MAVERTEIASALHPLDVLAPDELQALQGSLVAVTGLHISLERPNGQPLAPPVPLPPACRLLRQTVCRGPDLPCGPGSPGPGLDPDHDEIVVTLCPALDLQCARIPLQAEGCLWAVVTCGRVGRSAPGEQWLRERASYLRVDEGRLRAALQQTPAIDELRFRALVAHVALATQTLSRLAEARLAERRASRALPVANRHLGALGATAASIIRSSTLQDSLGEALQTILDVLRLDSGAIFLHEGNGTGARLAAHRGVAPAFVALADSALTEGVTVWRPFVESYQPWVVPDVAREPGLPQSLLQQTRIAAFVAAHLRTTESSIGALVVFAAEPRAFDPDEIALITAASEQLGLGLQAQRLLIAEKRRAGELATLNEVAVGVGKSLDLHAIVGEALDAAMRSFGAGAGLLYLLNDGVATPTLVAHRGLSGDSVRHWCDSPPVGWDPEAGLATRAQWGPDASAACARPDLALAEGLRSYIVAPLRGQRRTEGLLALFTREPRVLLANEVDLFQAVAHEIGLAVENAQLYRETQRRLADLEALQQFSERILHAMQEGIFIINTQGQVSYVTPRLAGLSGYAVDELIGRDWSLFIRPEDRDELQQYLGQLIGGRNVRRELDIVRKDGQLRHVSVGAVPLFDGEDFAGLLGVVTDLTEEVQLRRRLQQAEKLSALGELVSGVAHELNNPLTVIRGYAQLLRSREDVGPADRELEAITEHAERAARIVQGLLTFARERPPTQELVDLNAVLQSVFDMHQHSMATSSIQIVCELAAGLPRLRGDPYQLQQVFLNLLLNAEQALAETGHGGQVTIRTTPLADGSLLATIHDSGPGIAPAIADRIFDPFFTTKGDRQGTGLGLSICYGIVNAHGGRIWAENAPEGGATFFVTLPVAAVGSEPPAQPPVATGPETAPPAGGSVLVLEDEVEIAKLVARYLERLGCRVTVAHEAQAALQAVEGEDFDVILTDLKMPGMSGQEFFTRLHGTKPRLAERVIFVTGDSVSPDTRRFLARAGRPHLVKPFSLDEMHNLVAATLQGLEKV